MRHVGKHVSIEPARECLNESARSLDAQSAALRLAKAQVAAPPHDGSPARTAEADRFRITWVMVAQRSFRLAKQEPDLRHASRRQTCIDRTSSGMLERELADPGCAVRRAAPREGPSLRAT